MPLPLADPDDRARLERISATTRNRKAVGQAAAVAGLIAVVDRLPSPLVDVLAHLAHRQPFANAIVTNVPGPRQSRYLLGARITTMAPLVPLAANLDVSVGVLSYDGRLSFGCFADAERCGDVEVLAGGIRESMAALSRPAGQGKGACS